MAGYRDEDGKKRTIKACDRCRLKKVKCDGATPCSRCRQDDAICQFDVRSISEGKSVSAAHVNQLQSHNNLLAKALRAVWDRSDQGQDQDPDKVLSIHEIVRQSGALDAADSQNFESFCGNFGPTTQRPSITSTDPAGHNGTELGHDGSVDGENLDEAQEYDATGNDDDHDADMSDGDFESADSFNQEQDNMLPPDNDLFYAHDHGVSSYSPHDPNCNSQQQQHHDGVGSQIFRFDSASYDSGNSYDDSRIKDSYLGNGWPSAMVSGHNHYRSVSMSEYGRVSFSSMPTTSSASGGAGLDQVSGMARPPKRPQRPLLRHAASATADRYEMLLLLQHQQQQQQQQQPRQQRQPGVQQVYHNPPSSGLPIDASLDFVDPPDLFGSYAISNTYSPFDAPVYALDASHWQQDQQHRHFPPQRK